LAIVDDCLAFDDEYCHDFDCPGYDIAVLRRARFQPARLSIFATLITPSPHRAPGRFGSSISRPLSSNYHQHERAGVPPFVNYRWCYAVMSSSAGRVSRRRTSRLQLPSQRRFGRCRY